jgi:hypothetical protein
MALTPWLLTAVDKEEVDPIIKVWEKHLNDPLVVVLLEHL